MKLTVVKVPKWAAMTAQVSPETARWYLVHAEGKSGLVSEASGVVSIWGKFGEERLEREGMRTYTMRLCRIG